MKTTPDNPAGMQDRLFPDATADAALSREEKLKQQVSTTHAVEIVKPAEARGPGRKQQGFVQVDTAVHEQLWRLTLKSPTAVGILHFMIAQMRREATAYIVSAAALAEAMDISPRSVQGAIKLLEQYKFILVLKSGNTNAYVINSRVAWRGERGSRYAVMNSLLHVSEKEQGRTMEELETANEELIGVPNLEMLFDHGQIMDNEAEEVSPASRELKD